MEPSADLPPLQEAGRRTTQPGEIYFGVVVTEIAWHRAQLRKSARLPRDRTGASPYHRLAPRWRPPSPSSTQAERISPTLDRHRLLKLIRRVTAFATTRYRWTFRTHCSAETNRWRRDPSLHTSSVYHRTITIDLALRASTQARLIGLTGWRSASSP